MRWQMSDSLDQQTRVLADLHYSRQFVGAQRFVPPGRSLVLRTFRAYWVTSWPYAEFTLHRWAGLWVCSAFRREMECQHLASDLIRDGVAATRWYLLHGPPTWRYDVEPVMYDPEARCYTSFVTFVDPTKIKPKRDPGRCFLRAGFVRSGLTVGRGLIALVLPIENMPPPEAPLERGALNNAARELLKRV